MTEILLDQATVTVVIERAVTFATALVTVASVVAAMTPTPRDDTVLGQLYKVLEILALNVGRAKDAPPNQAGGRFTIS